ncbi:MAG: hypothetical protein IT379_27875 [Deltaproteobacteria bacterium]|nr:hypothetical protein [Deltaproteobacteria bacterium]
MAGNRGVTCPRCGASTPLPDDLRVPSFACAFCHATLETAAFAGRAAVSADALIGHMQAAVADPARVMDAARSAPRFEGGSAESRPSACKHCGAAVAVPLDLHVRELTCAACGRTQPVSAHVSDEERFALDMARQVAGNEALKRLKAEGVPCTKCGARNPVPDDGSVQLVCRFCGAAVLLSDHVDASAVARQRLKHGVYEMRDALMAKQARRQRTTTIVVVAIVVVVLAGFIVANLLVRS